MIVHQIYTGGEFDYGFYLSAMTAIRSHSYDKYVLWVLEPPADTRYYGLVEKSQEMDERVSVTAMEFDFAESVKSYDDWIKLACMQGKDENFLRVHLKDIYAWWVLLKYGGLFLDLDTISIYDLSVFYDQVTSFGTFEHKKPYPDDYNVAVMLSKPGNTFVQRILDEALFILQGDDIEWGGIGPNLLNSLLKSERPEDFWSGEFCVADGYGEGKIGCWFEDSGYVWDRCRVLHTYRSCPYSQQFVSDIDEEWIYESGSPYAKLVKTVLPVSVWNPYNIKQPPGTVRRIKRFHLLGLQHIPTSKDAALSCAYSQKVLKLGTMLKGLGHKVHFYGVEGSDVECDEFIQCSTQYMLDQSFGRREDTNKFYDLSKQEAIAYFNANAIREINRRKAESDFLLCMYGLGHKPIADGVGLKLTVEPGIGYRDTFAEFRVFESYNWMSYIYGLQGQKNGRNYDYVIPNYFDPDDFEFSHEKEDYFVFLGRLIWRKGLEIALQAAQATGIRLVVAGQDCNEKFNFARPGVEYIGYVGVEARKKLLSKAKGLLVPTMYIPPFEGVHIEAAFSGTPVITSDWGCFGETVVDGVTGYRCRTFDDYCLAIENIGKIEPYDCFRYAMNNYTMDVLKWRYEEYFEMLMDLMGAGWYQRRPDRVSKECLTRRV